MMTAKEGYAKVAAFMADEHTDGQYYIFQRFSALSAQNLLYLQAEILDLKENVDLIVEDELNTEEGKKKARDWYALTQDTNNHQWDAWLKLRSKLKEYHEAMDQHTRLVGLPRPRKQELRVFDDWLHLPSMGSRSLVGAPRDVYSTSNISDLAALQAQGWEVDDVALCAASFLLKLYHIAIVEPVHCVFSVWLKKPETPNAKTSPDLESTGVVPGVEEVADIEASIFFYREERRLRLANAVGAMLSSLIPIAAIVVLYLVKNMAARLIIVSAFTAVFSFSLAIVTNSRRAEIFAATAAFASVQVVFVGSAQWN